jgi:dolichol-phosphate mannosyltransferase
MKSVHLEDVQTALLPNAIELSIVVPTFNECGNILPLLNRLETALAGLRWEVIFVDDDSPDATADIISKVARQSSHVRVIRRIGRRGLTSACVEGVLSSSAPFFAVIDADMQHDESLLPQMFNKLKEHRLDLVIGSRYVQGGSVARWNRKRRWLSHIASKVARLVVKVELNDPMSGFFIMRRQPFDEALPYLSQHGFKFLLDLFASTPRVLQFAELPYEFRSRKCGESKFDAMVVWAYAMLLADKLFGQLVPPRFVLFIAVGAFGLLVHLVALTATLYGGFAFATSQTIAALTAMTFNFVLNNLATYRDKRLRGIAFVKGLLSFYVICSVGAVANIGIAAFLYSDKSVWWVAGLAGALVGSVWNFALSNMFTWERHRWPGR